MISNNKKNTYLQVITVLMSLFFLNSIKYAQVLPYDEPSFFSINPQTTPKSISLTEDEAQILDDDWRSGSKILENENVIYFLHFSMEKEINIQLQLDKNSFPENGKLFIVNPKIRGWVGPYRKEYIDIDMLYLTGRIKTSELIIEFSMPAKYDSLFPKLLIKSPFSGPDESETKPRYFHRPKRKRDNPVILLTGYWPPTNEAVRPFSQNSLLNPEGWIGENWEEYGFDIISYFPTFSPPDCESCGQGNGDFEVDYQDTSEDWWNIVDSLNPISIITFSRGYINYSWELEYKYYNWFNWINDFTPPYQPTPTPPDQDSPVNSMRFSSLPMTEIVDVVNSSDLGLNAYIDYAAGAGQYLSEFKGFHGVWYKALMDNIEDTPCYVAGHIHVGGLVDWDTAHEAVKITLRETINYIQENYLSPGDINRDGFINSLDLNLILSHINGFNELMGNEVFYADMDQDSDITSQDVVLLVNLMIYQN
tara:strand:+ start:317 stop:1750 length:1434 start_codon:yes stop_codon:yes gene_type:complete